MDIPDFAHLANLIDVPEDLLDVRKPMDAHEIALNSRYPLVDISEPQSHLSQNWRSGHLSRNITNTPTTRLADSFSDERLSPSSRNGVTTLKQSHSPVRPLSHRTSRHSGGGTKYDSYTMTPGPSTLPAGTLNGLRRKRSSASASTSTAVTARNSFEEIELVREPQYPDSEIYHNYIALAVSDHQPYESTRTFRSFEPHSFLREGSDYERRLDKGKMVEQALTPHASYSGDQGRRVKHERTEKQLYSGPLAHAEFERMKKEIENLKKTLHDRKKTIKKQTKKIEELKSQLNSETLAKMEQEMQVETLKCKCEKKDELVALIESSVQCQICMELLHKPFALSPCGHILCLSCLQEWFRKAPPSSEDEDVDPADYADDPLYILNRPKSCPCCRAVVTRRPVPVFTVKAITSALTKANSPSSRFRDDARSPSPYGDEDPWRGLFRPVEESDSSDDSSDEEFEDAVGWAALQGFQASLAGHGIEFQDDSSSSSASDDEEGGEPEESEGLSVDGDESDNYDGVYVPARWEPPSVDVNPEDYTFQEDEVDQTVITMLRRGCTVEMIQTYSMEYTHRKGLVAYLPSLEELYVYAEEEPDDIDGEKSNRIFLGWNIKVDESDSEGEMYMQWVLNDIKEYPERWHVEERRGMPGSFDVRKMVQFEEVEDYDTTDTEVWLMEDID
ncbi:hypothetical protein BDZ94DRAFT_1237662 [Collybia nuda]|uniref:RING-type domain-containing protein n=1 Tax=Collybia nuda TaxID=64659 RepID=A0A9P5Y4P1_9AGAR|nr:hypothetical protein BDZ94DRAFT_1237662 [Collybia nuda]